MMAHDVRDIFMRAAAEQEQRYSDVEADQSAGDEQVQVIFRVSAELRRQAKIRAATLDVTFAEYLRRLIQSDLGMDG